jgi:predicted permease
MRWWQIRKRNADLERELNADLGLEEEEQRERGLSPDEAHYAARRAFGNSALIRDQTRETWGWVPLERWWQDFRFALRQLARAPGFTTSVVLILALGVGATTAIFSLVNAALLQPLPFPQPDRLMWLSQQNHSLPGVVPESLSYPDYFDWRSKNHTFAGIATCVGGGITVQLKGESQRLDIQTVSSNFFQVLGVAPMMGRDFRLEDEQPGNRTVMLSYSIWQSMFGSAKDITGETLRMDDHSYTVAGVMPKGFQFPLENPAPALWISMADDAAGKKTSQRGFDVLSAIGRLKTGVTPEQAKADLSLIAAELARQYPDTNMEDSTALVQPELEHMTGDTRPALRVLFGAVMLVLLMVCANVAGLLLVRAARRGGEFALRAAIGASHAAIIRQLLVESVTLSLCGGIAGVGLGYGLLHALVRVMPMDIPRMQEASIDGRVLLFGLVISVATGLLFGVVPAWRMSRSAPGLALREGSRSVAGGRAQHRVHNGLVVAQTAIGLVLLVSSGLLMRSLVRILNVDPGFDPGHVLSARVGVPFGRYSHDQHLQFFEQLVARIAAVPGVQSASAGWPLPMSASYATITFNIQGRPVPRGDEPGETLGLAMPGYFATMRIPLISGRVFDERDGLKGQPTIIINQAFARKYFPGENPLGRHIQVRLGDDVFDQSVREIVGVVGNTRLKGLTDGVQPEYYLPYAQAVVTNPYLVIRTSGNPLAIQDAVRAVVQQMDKGVPVYQVSTLEDYVSKSAAQPRFQTFLLGSFAGMALILAAIGLYGLLSYVVVQRRCEIGVRMALGAQRTDILRHIIRRGLILTLAGVIAGLAIAFVVTQALTGMLYGIGPSDPVTFAAMAAVLLLVSVAASGLPAYRAARMDPNQALREP